MYPANHNIWPLHGPRLKKADQVNLLTCTDIACSCLNKRCRLPHFPCAGCLLVRFNFKIVNSQFYPMFYRLFIWVNVFIKCWPSQFYACMWTCVVWKLPLFLVLKQKYLGCIIFSTSDQQGVKNILQTIQLCCFVFLDKFDWLLV